MNNDDQDIGDCFWLFPLHFRNIMSNCTTIASSYLSNIWMHELLIFAAMSVALPLGPITLSLCKIMKRQWRASECRDRSAVSLWSARLQLSKAFFEELRLPRVLTMEQQASHEKRKSLVMERDIFTVTICRMLTALVGTFYSIVTWGQTSDVHRYCYCHASKKRHSWGWDFDTEGAFWCSAAAPGEASSSPRSTHNNRMWRSPRVVVDPPLLSWCGESKILTATQ